MNKHMEFFKKTWSHSDTPQKIGLFLSISYFIGSLVNAKWFEAVPWSIVAMLIYVTMVQRTIICMQGDLLGDMEDLMVEALGKR